MSFLLLAGRPAFADGFRYIDRDGRAHAVVVRAEDLGAPAEEIHLGASELPRDLGPAVAERVAFAELPGPTEDVLREEEREVQRASSPSAPSLPGRLAARSGDLVTGAIAAARRGAVTPEPAAGAVAAGTERLPRPPPTRSLSALTLAVSVMPPLGSERNLRARSPVLEPPPVVARLLPAGDAPPSRAGDFSLSAPRGGELRRVGGPSSSALREVGGAAGETSDGPEPPRHVPGATAPPHAAEIIEAAETAGVPAELLFAVVKIESNFVRSALSSAGAQGLTQLMPATARDLGVVDPFDPRENLLGGARLLRRLIDMHNGKTRVALAAYHAGPAAVRRAGGRPPTEVTREYVDAVLDAYLEYITRRPLWLQRLRRPGADGWSAPAGSTSS